MNTPNPLVPQGALPDNRGKSHIRIAVFTILAIHVVLLGALLFQGCKPTAESNVPAEPTNANLYAPPPFDPTVATTPPPETNPPTATETSPPPPPYTPPPTYTPPPPEPPAPLPGAEHVVTKGDSFSVLAKKYNVTSRAIAEANPGVDSSRLKIGQKLHIPAPSVAPAGLNNGNGAAAATNGGDKTYAVKSGDTLTKIAKDHRTTVKAIQNANGLRTHQIKVGQKLKIPVKAPAPEATPASPVSP